jgi:hypothetical protein
MPLPRIFPAMCLSLVALFNLTPAFADDTALPRPPEWAQPVEVQYNLFQMSPTLYRSALPDSGAVSASGKTQDRHRDHFFRSLILVVDTRYRPGTTALSHQTMWMTQTSSRPCAPFKPPKPKARF